LVLHQQWKKAGDPMFRTVLVPLDGSPFAEQALPYALGIVRRADAILDLVHVHVLYVLEEQIVARYSYDPELDEEQRRREQVCLEGTAKWLAAVAPVPMTTAVVNGLGADGILQRAQVSKVGLLVMTTHGRGPLGRFFLGSVADEMIRRAAVPVLLVRPREPAPGIVPEPLLEHVLVPLDGSPLAESVLEPALDLVRAWEGRCTLLRVVEASRTTGGTLVSPNQPRPPEAEQEAAAQAYLEKIAGRLREEGVAVQTRVVIAPHAAPIILVEAQTQRCDFIALATHGRRGVRRMLLGSIADKVIRGSSSPVLVYRPPND
jgi:nucleotide-binding universal stress UspA family protein